VRLVALTDIGRAVLADAIELWVAADDRAGVVRLARSEAVWQVVRHEDDA
jgi:hypothetical protein